MLSALRTRVLEMQWLRNQLREYLRLHGVDTMHPDRVSLAPADSGDLRHWIDLREELGEMLKRNRPSPERFRSTQASFKPFVSWMAQYSEAFLYPVSFLDRLSEIYEQPLKRDWSAPNDDARRQLVKALVALLGRRSASDFHPGFNWEPMGLEALPGIDKYAVVPSEWQICRVCRARSRTCSGPNQAPRAGPPFLLQFQCSTSLELACGGSRSVAFAAAPRRPQPTRPPGDHASAIPISRPRHGVAGARALCPRRFRNTISTCGRRDIRVDRSRAALVCRVSSDGGPAGCRLVAGGCAHLLAGAAPRSRGALVAGSISAPGVHLCRGGALSLPRFDVRVRSTDTGANGVGGDLGNCRALGIWSAWR